MTSREPPDYDAKVRLTPEEFQHISGMSFTVIIAIMGPAKTLNGMIIIPQLGNEPDESGMSEAWLWLDKACTLLPGTDIKVELQELCDPMFISDDESNLNEFSGLKLGGVITHKTNYA